MSRRLYILPFINLIIATALGTFLRYINTGDIAGVNFKYVLHAHSHVAFLGWAFMALFLAIWLYFIKEDKNRKTYLVIFWLNQVTVLGMLVTFPFTGYAAASIAFSTAHILLSYWFIYRVLKDIRKGGLPEKFLKAGLLFLAISSIGPWLLGIIMAKGLGNTAAYSLAIYFYLHFQYNGWFIFGLLALLMKAAEIYYPDFIPQKQGKTFFIIFFIGTILSYAFAAQYEISYPVVNIIAVTAGVTEIAALFYFMKILLKAPSARMNLKIIPAGFLLTAFISFIIKTGIQFFASLLPSLHNRFFLIGYLHLILIGVITFGLIGFLFSSGLIQRNRSISKAGFVTITAGFILTEVYIFIGGIGGSFFGFLIETYSTALLICSLILFLGFIITVLSIRFNNKGRTLNN